MTTCLKEKTMYTENGRKEKADNKEIAGTMMRSFVCMSCGEKASKKSKQFGEKVECPVCNNEMLEVKE